MTFENYFDSGYRSDNCLMTLDTFDKIPILNCYKDRKGNTTFP